jgi:hypothetical protein
LQLAHYIATPSAIAASIPKFRSVKEPQRCAFAATDAAAQKPAIQFPAITSVLPQFAFGGGWYSALYFTNVTASVISFSVTFIDANGQPLTVPSVGGSTAQVNLAAYGTAIIEAPNAGSLV